ncbi:HAF repeat-containing protein [Micromonospora sp. HK10]|uniref:HAF repeat-containing protein n=1 Tax=Micromonospora sp. HK10 TaxID=1538294 RepID=UPI0006981B25|nr:HAF repeat-containing protein [Micromonospora sp. HK10]
MMRRIGPLACALLITIPLLAAPAQASARRLTARDIHPSGWMSSVASEVNRRGEVIITATNQIDSEIQPPLGFVWRAGRHTVLRPLPGGTGTLPRDINEHGLVVGFCQSVAYAARPCLWWQGRPRDLGTLDERGTGTALAVNDLGEVVGENETYIRGGETRAFIWRRGVLTDLGGTGNRIAVGINNHGQVIGVHDTGAGQRGFLWQRGVLTDLGTLGGADSVPADLNEHGQIVGTSTTADGSRHAFLWQDGRMTDLGPPSGDSGAVAINDRGQVVGWTSSPTAVGSFSWQGGVRTKIDGYVGDLNERGWIAGTSAGQPRRAFLLRHGRLVTGGPAEVIALNDRGLLVGWRNVPAGQHATIWR